MSGLNIAIYTACSSKHVFSSFRHVPVQIAQALNSSQLPHTGTASLSHELYTPPCHLPMHVRLPTPSERLPESGISSMLGYASNVFFRDEKPIISVSYTHLTLP